MICETFDARMARPVRTVKMHLYVRLFKNHGGFRALGPRFVRDRSHPFESSTPPVDRVEGIYRLDRGLRQLTPFSGCTTAQKLILFPGEPNNQNQIWRVNTR